MSTSSATPNQEGQAAALMPTEVAQVLADAEKQTFRFTRRQPSDFPSCSTRSVARVQSMESMALRGDTLKILLGLPSRMRVRKISNNVFKNFQAFSPLARIKEVLCMGELCSCLRLHIQLGGGRRRGIGSLLGRR